ncbi:MAG: glycerophosphodiester phosphodiesterase [Cephaloticoccus sp.]|nr:glycerophosphodiester phosphodiesterase [Cephaloticoccus sp.]
MGNVSLAAIYRDPHRVAVTAHRGFSGLWPENTLPAFAAAIAAGADLIEFDLQPCREEIPVVMHDATVDRTTDGRSEISTIPLAALRELNASWWEGSHAEDGFRRTTPADPAARIPTFAELLDAFAGRVGMNIHLKPNPSAAMLAEVCRLFHRHNLYASGYISVNSYAEGVAVRQLDGHIPLCLLVGQNQMEAAALDQQKTFGVCCLQPGRNDVTPDFCARARSLDLPTNIFWANDPTTVEKFVAAGVQGLLTDWPDRVIATLQRLGRR